MKKYRIVLMDADDTIFDFHRSEYCALKLACENCGTDFDDEIAMIYSRINDSLWKSLERGEITRKELHCLRFEKLCAAVGFSTEKKSVTALNEAYVQALSQQIFPLGNAFETLSVLSERCAVYIVTNGMARVQRPRFEKSGLNRCVNGIFISEEMNVSKPSAAFFEQVLQKIHAADKKDILVVGDSLTSDMQGGRNSGLDTCLFDFRNQIEMPHPLCDYKITRLDALLNYV